MNLTFKMNPRQEAVFARVRSNGGLNFLEYLAEDWRTTSPMLARGWLWMDSSAAPGAKYIFVGERKAALRTGTRG